MLVKIIGILLINSEEYKKLFPGGKPEALDLVLILCTIRRTIEGILFDMFFEDPGDALDLVLILEKRMIKTKISLEENFYNKHFGRLTEEQREKELNELIARITEELDEINWREVIQ